MEKLLHLDEREITITGKNMDNIVLEGVLTINYEEIREEIKIFPFVLHQVNTLFIEATNVVNNLIFERDVLKDNLSELKSRLSFPTIEKLKNEKGIKTPTIGNIEDEISQIEDVKILKNQIQNKNKEIIEHTKNKEYLASLYWSAKAKQDTLISLSSKIEL